MAEEYDVVVLGGGAGGVPAAIRAAQLGGRVAVVEKGDLGGLCMNRGCVPFGQMMVVSRMLGRIPLMKELGVDLGEPHADYSALRSSQKNLIGFMRQGVRSLLSKNKVSLIEGAGRIEGKGRVSIDGRMISCKRLILATGSRWRRPDWLASLDRKDLLQSDDLLDLTTLPARLLLYGESPWLIEIAQFLSRIGTKVHLATPGKSILAGESKVVRSRLAAALKKESVPLLTGVKIEDIGRRKGAFHCRLSGKSGEEILDVDGVMALERKGALDDIGLESLGLDPDADLIPVNERMESPAKGVYAIGDLTAHEDLQSSHMASAGGMVAAENAMGMDSTLDPRLCCRILFSHPQTAAVGMTAKEAKKAGYDVVAGTAPLSMNTFGMMTLQQEGIVEVVAERRYGEILGIHMIGDGISEMAGQAVMAIRMESTLEELAGTSFPHPTLSESLSEAARECLGRAVYLP